MAVVIHDFEIIAEPAPAAPIRPGENTAPVPAPLTPHDMENVLRRALERALRVRAG